MAQTPIAPLEDTSLVPHCGFDRDFHEFEVPLMFPWFGPWHFIATMGAKASRFLVTAEVSGYDVKIEKLGKDRVTITCRKKPAGTILPPYYHDGEKVRLT